MSELPVISVVIPVKNRPKGLQITLDNCIGCNNIEIIVINDGGDKKVSQTINRNRRYLNIKELWIEKPIGPASGRNIGVKEAKSDWILFLDDYIQLPKNWLNRLLPFLSRYDYLATNVKIKPQKKELLLVTLFRLRMFPKKHSKVKIEMGCSACLLVKKKLFNKIGGFKNIKPGGEDYIFAQEIRNEKVNVIYLRDFIVWHSQKTLFCLIKDYNKLNISKKKIEYIFYHKKYPSIFEKTWAVLKIFIKIPFRILFFYKSNFYKKTCLSTFKFLLGYIGYVIISSLVKAYSIIKV